MSVILAIDPGYDRCGLAIVEYDTEPKLIFSKCIETNKKDAHQNRLLFIFEAIKSEVERCKPDFIALETLFFSVNKKTVIKVSEARGIAVLLAGIFKIELIEMSPQEVKQAMTGVGNADKKQVKKMVQLTLKIDISQKIDDEIDAISLGFAAAQRIRLGRLHI